MTYRSPLWVVAAARPRAAATSPPWTRTYPGPHRPSLPEERERLLSRSLPRARKRMEDGRAPNSLLMAAEAIEALRSAGGL